MKIIEQEDLNAMSKDYRARFINSLSGFKSANIIGTCSPNGINNLAIFSSVIHLGAIPPLVGFITRPNTVARHTLENIQQTEQYTINQVSTGFWQAAHQTSARYEADQCEFTETGLTPENIHGIAAPFVKESKLKYALALREIIPIQANGTLLIIGEISKIICHSNAIKSDGYIDIEHLNTVMISGLDSYHTGSRLSRLSYARPHKELAQLSLDGEVVSSNCP